MIDGLISGRLIGAPVERTAKNGSTFATAKVRVATKDGSIFANVITFSASTVAALMVLGDGDSVSLSGELAIKVYTDKDGIARPSLDLVAHCVLSAYDVQRRRSASSTSTSTSTKSARDTESQEPPPAAAPCANGAPFDDVIPF